METPKIGEKVRVINNPWHRGKEGYVHAYVGKDLNLLALRDKKEETDSVVLIVVEKSDVEIVEEKE